MQLIEHIVIPERLLLAWQAPEGEDRTRLVVAELRREADGLSFQYLADSEDFQRAVELGFVCFPAFRKTHLIHTHGVLDAFLRRIPPRKRSDFGRFLEQWRIPADASLDDWTLLAYSGARLPSDGFSLVWPLEEIHAPGEVLLEVAGFRYTGISIDDLVVGTPVDLMSDPENPVDGDAIRFEADGTPIGYVNRLQCESVSRWLTRYDIDASIERINGTPERPLIYIFCKLRERVVLKAAAG